MPRKENVARFMEVYVPALKEMVEKHLDQYWWSKTDTVEEVASRMEKALERKSYNKDGKAIKLACKRLGIKHTYTGMEEFFNGSNS